MSVLFSRGLTVVIGQFVLTVCLIAAANVGQAATLSVDIGESTQTAQGEVQAGFIGWDVTTASPQTLNLTDPFGTGDNVTVSLSTSPAGFSGTRDRGIVAPTASPLSDLLRDFLFEAGGSSVTLGFNGLPLGNYTIDTYHHDDDNVQGDADVFLTDSIVTGLAVGNADTTTNADLPGAGILSVDFFADGNDPVSLRFDTNGNQMFNGFVLEFTAVPEPSSVAMWVVIGLTVGGFGYWRTRRKV